MASFLLMRHAEQDYSLPKKWNTPGWGNDLAPLTATGEEQVIQQLDKVRAFDPEMVLCSPMTRTLQSALILRSALNVPFKIEFDLHEWVPDRTFQWRTAQDVQLLVDEHRQCNGEWPSGETRVWETDSAVRLRVFAALRKYDRYQRVLVVCHAGVINAVTHDNRKIEFAELVPLESTALE